MTFATALASLFFQVGTTAAQTATSAIVNVNSGKCADVEAGGWNSGDRIIQYTCHGQDNQQWSLTAFNGSYQIVGKRLGQCLTVAGDSSAAGAQMVQYPCGGYVNQLWDLRISGSAYQLIAKQTGMCLMVQNASLQDVIPLAQQACQGSAAERWTFSNPAVLPSPPPGGATLTTIVPSHSGKCLMFAGGSTAAGAQAIQAACDGSAAQKWKVAPSGSDYTIVSNNSGLCLGISGGSTALEAPAVQMSCSGAANTRWTLRAAGTTYALIAKHSGLCLDIYGGSRDDGANAIQWTCENGANQLWTLTVSGAGGGGTAPPSSWSAVIPLPIVPVAAANLPNGKVLAWSAYAPDNFGDENRYGYTYTALFDPATQTSQARVVSDTGHDMFCPGTSQLADGRLLVNGGSSSQKTSIYNPFTDSWSSGPLMNIPRGYQGNATLASGSVLTLGGSWSGGLDGKIGEVWTPGGSWRRMSGIGDNPFTGPDPAGVFRGDNHLWLFTYSSGRVFHAGPTAAMHWITTGGNGRVTNAGTRGDDGYSMNGNAVMYDAGKILKTGGAPAYENAYATASSYVIDLDSGATRRIAPMNYARTLHNSVVLPNGQVVITGGQTYAKLFSDERSVLMAELWDPKTESFILLSPMSIGRNYHSFSLLLPDGRVLVGGGGLCGACTANHADAEILTPPYLLNTDGTPAARPAITAAPASGTYGGTLAVSTDTAVSGFVLMRLSAATHSLNNDQRRVPLPATTGDNRNYALRIPADAGLAPPGYYMLFALDANGVPSLSRTVQIK